MTSLNGILIIDKPAGWTSHDVVAKLRGTIRQKRVGHGGTLDPMATGVLPIFVGKATRAAEFCENAEKEYVAGLCLGVVTDTQDITGKVLSENAVTATADDLCAVLPAFLGRHKQIPPMYSAIKKNGMRLYEYARRGEEVERPARDIEISAIELVEKPVQCHAYEHTFYIRVACSKGTYIRTLCHDIGQALGCGATLSYLRRTKAGVFMIDQAHTLDAADFSSIFEFILPVDSIFSHYPAYTLSSTETQKVKNGALRKVGSVADGRYRVYAPGGEFLSFAEVKSGEFKTIKNFFEV